MLAPAVTSTGAAQVAEPMIVAEPEKKSTEKRSHDNLDDPEVDAAAKRAWGSCPVATHTQLWYPHSHKKSFQSHQMLEWSSALSHPSSSAPLLLSADCSTNCRASICPHPPFLNQPPQQPLQPQGAAGLSGPVASGANAQADEPTQPPGPIPLAAINGAGGTVAVPSIFGNN